MSKKRILIRTDSSYELGYGHIYRCLTLAVYLRNLGWDVEFIAQPLPGNINHLVIQKEFKLHEYTNFSSKNSFWENDLENTYAFIKSYTLQFDWLIIDHYLLDHQWETPFFQLGIKLLVIDDLATMKHQCHALLNQTFNVDKQKYLHLVLPSTKLLLGEQYMLLRSEFLAQRKNGKKAIDLENPRIHVFFGSTESGLYSFKFCTLLLTHFPDTTLKVVAHKQNLDQWNALQDQYPNRMTINHHVENMARDMAECDLALGAPGMATWERASLGIPGIYLATNANQVSILNSLQQKNFCYFIGKADEIDDCLFINSMTKILHDKQKLEAMSSLGFSQIDGRGTERVANNLVEFI